MIEIDSGYRKALSEGLCLFALTIGVVSFTMGAETQPVSASDLAASGDTSSAGAEPWQPPTPPPDEFDWVQMNSGEWLKGEIQYMERDTLNFDSDELDDLILDMEDIKYIRSPRTNIVSFEDMSRAVGTIEITKDKVRIQGEETAEFERVNLLGITPGAPKERNYWSAKASVGLTAQSGNTEQVTFGAKARIWRRTPNNRLGLDYLGNIGSVNGVETVNNHRANALFDIFLSRRLYLRTPFAEYFRDPFQNIAYRGTGGVGIGYQIIDRSKFDWEVSAGPAFQYTVFDSVEPGSSSSASTPAVFLGTLLDKELTKRLDLIFEYRGFVMSREAGQASHHTVLTLEYELTDILDFDVSAVWDRMENPRRSASGVVPEKDDFYLMLSFGVDI